MSKHHNYQNYSKPNNQLVEPTPVVEEEVVEAVEEVTEESIEEVVEETVEEVVPVSVTGVVSGCKKLNVRKSPTPLADVLCVLNENSKVEISEDDSTVEFYKVTTASGVEGYCMKKFITVK